MLICLTRERSKQNSSETTNDFETFVRESPAKLNKGQDSILHDVATLRAEVQINNASMSDISRRPTNFNQNNEERASSMERCKSDSFPSSVIRVNIT